MDLATCSRSRCLVVPLAALLAVLALAASARMASATAIYSYVGNPFSSVDSSTSYTTSDFISGQVTLATALAPNLTDEYVSGQVQSFSFSDGVRTHDESTTPGAHFYFSTDGAGAIVGWTVALYADDSFLCSVNASGGMTSCNGSAVSDFVGWLTTTPVIDFGVEAENSDVPGMWTMVPEPATGVLLAFGVLGLALRPFFARSVPS